jgi:ligand-binding sensor domain-containing protein/AraC-like DNA-binding protein
MMHKPLFVKRRAALFVFCLALMSAAFCHAGAGYSLTNLIQDEFDHRSGFPLPFVSSMAQTPDGYLWLTGNNKLLRYDGIQFEAIENAHGRLLLDRSGILWYCTASELVSYRNGVYARHPYPEGITIRKGINALADDRKGNLWIARDRDSLIQYEQGRFIVHDEVSSATAVIEDRRGNLWIGTYHQGLLLYQHPAFVACNGWSDRPLPSITCMAVDREHALWVGTGGQGLFQITQTATASERRVRRYQERNGLPFDIVTCIETDRHGDLFIGTVNGFCRLTKKPDDGYDISDRFLDGASILQLFFDHEESLWVGTLTRGLIRLRQGVFRYKADFASLSPTLFRSPAGDIWIGTILGNLIRYRDHKNHLFLAENHTENRTILAIAADESRLYLGTLREGLFEFSAGELRRPQGFPLEQNNGVLAILIDRQHRLLVGTTTGLLVRHKGRVERFSSKNLLLSDWIYRLYEDSAGDLWVCSAQGVMQFSAGRLQADSRRVHLPGVHVLDMREDSRDPQRFWFCSLSGLQTVAHGQWFTFNQDNGLGSNTLHQLFEDDREQFWISSADGIMQVGKKELLEFAKGASNRYSCLHFGRADGLAPILSFRPQNSIIQTPERELWFSTSEGIAILDPEKIVRTRQAPKIALKELIVDGKRIEETDRRQFRGARNITFSLALLTFVDQERIQLAYRLQGLHDEWHTLKPRQRSLTFSDLPRGRYTLMVTVKNREGFVDPGGFQFGFSFNALFYESALFILLLATLLVGGFFLAVWLRRRLRLLKEFEALKPDSSTPSERASLIHHRLLIKMESEKGYKNEDITLHSLAKSLGIQPWELSKVINETMKQNFWTLLNGYRIREACDLLLKMPETGQTILDICYEVGFNSKSSFYRAFKGITGMSPNEFVGRNGRGSGG